MNCPACKKKLKLINAAQPGEYICDNVECPTNKDDITIFCEFYGTQKEINKQWP